MSKIPEVFAIFEQKLAHVLSFTVVPLKSKDLKNALEEILTYFSSIVERASKAESRIAELEKALNIDTDLTIAGLRKELRDATARIAELETDNAEFRQLIRDWSIVLEQNNGFWLWQVESVRQAMLEINKERER